MIVRRVASNLVLIDRQGLSQWLRRPVATIRVHCRPVACDVATRRALYDVEACQAQLGDIQRRVRVA